MKRELTYRLTRAAQTGLIILFSLVFTLFLLAACDSTPSARAEFISMDTPMRIEASGVNSESAVTAAQKRVEELDQLFSLTGPGSDISAINERDDAAITVRDESIELIEASLELARESDGALDITICPISKAWGFTGGERKVPQNTEIESLLALVGYQQINIDHATSSIQVEAGASIDLGAVAKGYACAEVVEILKDAGISSALVDLGGTIGVIGAKTDGSAWRIGLRDPHVDERTSLGTLSLEDSYVATSGMYERFVTGIDGTNYGHILDPNTGMPCDTGIASVSIVSDDATRCDGLSTALFVLGPEKATELWRSSHDFGFIIVLDDGSILISEDLESSFTLSDPARTMTVIA